MGSKIILLLLLGSVLALGHDIPPADLLVDGHILPPHHDGILINIPQRLLFYFEQGALIGHYPIAVGQPGWRTPTGDFQVDEKRVDPVWYIPKSIQEEMRRHGKTARTSVPPGAANPLGKYWLGIGGTGCGIHGTNAPNSISQYATHGCIRMYPEDIAELFPRVTVGTPIRIVYEPVLLELVDARIYLEVHRDAYRKGGDLLEKAKALAAEKSALVDWNRAQEVIENKEGIARDVTRSPGGEP